jgi:S-layer homology domain/Kelch motif
MPAGATADNKLYAIGGYDASGSYTSSVEMFDPATDIWTARAPMIDREAQMNAASIGNHIYVPGGFFSSGAMQIYNVISDTWRFGSPLPYPRLAEGVAALSGEIYIVGGTDTFGYYNTVWAYDPISDTYAVKSPLPQAEEGLVAVALGGHIYAFGGFNGFVHYVYDPTSDSWSSVAAGLTPDFSEPASFVLNGEIWLVGGTNASGQPYPPNQQVQIYNPGSDTWRYGPALNTPRGGPAGEVIDGQGYIDGGQDTNGYALTSVESISYAGCGTPFVTNTPIPATSTPTSPVPTSTPTATATPPPSATSTNTEVAPTNTPSPASSATPTDCANPFVDIQGNIFYPAIHYLNCRGVVNGTDATHYSPGGTSTRGQFAKVVVLGFGLPFYTPGTPDFSDVLPGYFAYLYIESGYHAGILGGFDAGSCTAHGAQFPCYLPNIPITRGQLTKLVVNAGGYTLYTPPSGQDFNDVPPSNVFYASIETAYHNGIINGYSDHTFRPNNNIRRDEMAQIVFEGINHRP